MGYETATQGLGDTRNFYGPRDNDEGTEGSHKTFGSKQQKVLDISNQSITDQVFLVDLAFLPAGALVVAAFVQVLEAFDTTGTTSINVGTEGSEGTNGVDVSAAIAEGTLITTDISGTLAGTWTAGLAADTQINVIFDAGGETAGTDVGHMRVTIEYVILGNT